MDISRTKYKSNRLITCANPKAQFLAHKDEINNAVNDVLNSSTYILGKNVELFESEFSDYIGSKYSVGVANGTDALELALIALNIGKGDEVISVSHTAIATISAITSSGATPVMVDIEDKYYTIDPKKIKIAISKKTKALIVVHLYGQSANIEELSEICKHFNIHLIEDVSQAHGAEYRGKKLGTFGEIGCFSCYPTKNLGAIGDGGIAVTNKKFLFEKIKNMRQYGWKQRNISQYHGRNSRLDEIQAAILRVKLKYLDKDNNERIEIAKIYNNSLPEVIVRPSLRKFSKHVYHLYAIKFEERNKLLNYLEKKNIYPGIHYPIPIHMQNAYKYIQRIPEKLSVTESTAKTTLSLPLYPGLSHKDVKRVVDEIKLFVGSMY